MKKILAYLSVAIIVFAVVHSSCNKDASISHIALNRTTAEINIGDTLTLTAYVLPNNSTNVWQNAKNVSWSSSNPDVATVTNGKITALSEGTANITVTTDNGNKTATCTITTKPVPVTSVTISKINTGIPTIVGDTFTLIAIVLPNNATNKNVTSWSSSDTSVATVINGFVTTFAYGTPIFTVTTQDGNKRGTYAVAVRYTQNCNNNVPGWGSSLGTITRGSETTISSNGITQIWSDAISTTACNKQTFVGGGEGGETIYYADCRSNPDHPGDLFSWCAVIRFQDEFCPAPWRVPTREDFINLDKAFGGSGEIRHSNSNFINTNYIARWGGAFGSFVSPFGSGLMSSWNKLWGCYWSQTEVGASGAALLRFSMDGSIHPGQITNRGNGFTLRCIRDN